MSERAISLLLSAIIAAVAVIMGGWLIATGEVSTIDGLFLFCSCVAIAFAFGLYVRWMLRSAMSEAPAALRAGTECFDRGTRPHAKTATFLPSMHRFAGPVDEGRRSSGSVWFERRENP
jgi:hypothetical protein